MLQGGPAGNLVFLVTVSESADLAHWAWNQLLGRRLPWRIVPYSQRTWYATLPNSLSHTDTDTDAVTQRLKPACAA